MSTKVDYEPVTGYKVKPTADYSTQLNSTSIYGRR